MRRELVEAGAGCGKTYSIVSRYIEALGYDEHGKRIKGQELLPPNEIVCLTFTELAAAQMLERILERLDLIGLEDLKAEVLENCKISTFHSYCYKAINPFLDELGYQSSEILPASMSREGRKQWLLRRIQENENSVLDIIKLNSLIELALELWFEKQVPDASRLTLILNDFKDTYQSYIKTIKTELENSIVEFDYNLSKNPNAWPKLALEQLSTKSPNLSKLNFAKSGSPSLNRKDPELYRKFSQLRDFHAKGYSLLLDKDAILNEAQSQHKIFTYINELKNKATKLLDFSALEAEFIEILSNPVQLKKISKPKLFIVDEFQDTSPEQFHIIEKLSSAETQWYFVGDPKQSIYSFRKADIRLYNKLRDSLNLIELDTNRRSHPELLKVFNCLQQQIFNSSSSLDPKPQSLKHIEENFDKCNPLGPPSRVFEVDRGESFFEHFYNAYRVRKKEKPNRSHAVLFRSWKKLYEYSQKLLDNKTPFRILGSENYLNHHLSELFIQYLFLAENPENKEAQLALARWIKGSYSEDLEASKEQCSPSTLNTQLLNFCRITKPNRWLSGAEWAAAMERKLISLEKLGILYKYSGTDLAHYIQNSILYDDSNLESTANKSFQSEDVLNLMTVHASKGLEFDCVYLVEPFESLRTQQSLSLGEDQDGAAKIEFFSAQSRSFLPSLYYKVKAYDKSLAENAESKRVFYVAFTRAKQCLDSFIHTPSKSARTELNSPLCILGLELGEKSPWNITFIKVMQSLNPDLMEWIKIEKDEDTSIEEEIDLWRVPQIINKTDNSSLSYYRGGLSSYLNLGQKKKFVNLSDKAQQTTELGTKLHEALSLWNGNPDDIFSLPFLDEHPEFEDLLLKIKRLPQLESYWQLAETNANNLFREMPMLIDNKENYTLSGVADAIAFLDDKIQIIDWKSSGSLYSLKSPDRLSKINKQLDLYATAFAYQNMPIQKIAIGIDLNRKSVEVILDESFHNA